MKPFLFTLMLVVLGVSLSSPVEARRGGGGSTEFMELIAPVDLTDRNTGGALALCHLVKKTHALFVPLWYESDGYALAQNGCDAESYYAVDAETLAGLKADGLVAADVPDEPSLSIAQSAMPFLWGGLVLILIGAKFVGKRGGSRSASANKAPNDFTSRVLETACRAALADGHVEDREVAIITGIANQFTTGQVDPDRMRKMVGYVRTQPAPPDYTHLGSGLDDTARNQLLRVAMLVIGKDNLAEGDGKTFIDKLAMDLLIEPQRRDALAAAI